MIKTGLPEEDFKKEAEKLMRAAIAEDETLVIVARLTDSANGKGMEVEIMTNEPSLRDVFLNAVAEHTGSEGRKMITEENFVSESE